MRLKDIDNPWLVVRLPLMLGTFGMIAGTALAPVFVGMISPDTTIPLDPSSQHHPNWYWNGAGIGLAIGLAIAFITLFTLRKHEAEEAASATPHAAH